MDENFTKILVIGAICFFLLAFYLGYEEYPFTLNQDVGFIGSDSGYSNVSGSGEFGVCLYSSCDATSPYRYCAEHSARGCYVKLQLTRRYDKNGEYKNVGFSKVDIKCQGDKIYIWNGIETWDDAPCDSDGCYGSDFKTTQETYTYTITDLEHNENAGLGVYFRCWDMEDTSAAWTGLAFKIPTIVECVADSDCTEEQLCDDTLSCYTPECILDFDCSDGEYCSNYECIQMVLPEVTNIGIDGIGVDYANLKGQFVSEGGDLAEKTCSIWWQYRKVGSDIWLETEVQEFIPRIYTTTVTGLDSNTEYEFRHAAENEAGTSHSSIKLFTTKRTCGDVGMLTTEEKNLIEGYTDYNCTSELIDGIECWECIEVTTTTTETTTTIEETTTTVEDETTTTIEDETTTTIPYIECYNASDCIGLMHPAIEGDWECINNLCEWIEKVITTTTETTIVEEECESDYDCPRGYVCEDEECVYHEDNTLILAMIIMVIVVLIALAYFMKNK